MRMASSPQQTYPGQMNLPLMPIGPAGVAALIPHAGAMRLIDRVDAVSEEAILCSTSTHLSPDNPLRWDGGLPASAAIEYAAQAMAIHGALTRPEQDMRQGPRRGFIVVASGVTWTRDRLDESPAPLAIEATRLAATSGGAQYAFRVSGPELDVEGTLTLSLEVG